jgi:predicted CXXCH cytochrome family protein
MKRAHGIALALVCVVALAVAWYFAAHTVAKPIPLPFTTPDFSAQFVGSARCASCHAQADAAWRGSQHAQAMQAATPETVLGRFDGQTLNHGKSSTRYFKRDGRFWVATEEANGKKVEREITHTFGVFPLQQYLVSEPDGRRQSLGVAWDSRGNDSRVNDSRVKPKKGAWFHIFPDTGTTPGHPLHWSGIDQNWNYQCADCHSTNLKKGFDAKADRFNTTWSEMNVACEACHGPGSAHVSWAEKSDKANAADIAQARRSYPGLGLTAVLTERQGVSWAENSATGTRTRSTPRDDKNGSEREIEVCARCHSRRGQISDAHVAGQPLYDAFRPATLDAGLYHSDGQQRDEVYTYASFRQSRMHAAGVTCSDCHEPHSGKLRGEGNAVCAQCHEPARFDAASHHHHKPGSQSAQCVSCHMPTTTYMGVDARRDHSLRIPRPDRTQTLGVPNACASCHAKEGAPWASAAVRSWFPNPKPGHQDFADAFALAEAGDARADEALLSLLRRADLPAQVRASALRRLPMPLSTPALALVGEALSHNDDGVRLAAVMALAQAEPKRRAYYLAPLLSDARRVVRIEAARHLAGPPETSLEPLKRSAFDAALAELIAAENFNAERPEAQTALGDLYAVRGMSEAAEAAYRAAQTRDASFEAGWINHAAFLSGQGREDEARRVLSEGLKRSASPATSANVQHALGLSHIRAGARKEGLTLLAAANKNAPDNARFAYVYAVAAHDSGDLATALKVLRNARVRHPNEASLADALRSYEGEAGR